MSPQPVPQGLAGFLPQSTSLTSGNQDPRPLGAHTRTVPVDRPRGKAYLKGMTELTVAEATEITARLRTAATEFFEVLEEAFGKSVHTTLGYRTFRAYLEGEMPGFVPPKIDREARDGVILRLLDGGMSTRDAASVTGAGKGTVARVSAPNGAPSPTPYGRLEESDADQTRRNLGYDGSTDPWPSVQGSSAGRYTPKTVNADEERASRRSADRSTLTSAIQSAALIPRETLEVLTYVFEDLNALDLVNETDVTGLELVLDNLREAEQAVTTATDLFKERLKR